MATPSPLPLPHSIPSPLLWKSLAINQNCLWYYIFYAAWIWRMTWFHSFSFVTSTVALLSLQMAASHLSFRPYHSIIPHLISSLRCCQSMTITTPSLMPKSEAWNAPCSSFLSPEMMPRFLHQLQMTPASITAVAYDPGLHCPYSINHEEHICRLPLLMPRPAMMVPQEW